MALCSTIGSPKNSLSEVCGTVRTLTSGLQLMSIRLPSADSFTLVNSQRKSVDQLAYDQTLISR